MTVETLDDYDFHSVYDYMEGLTKHIKKKSKGDVDVIIMVINQASEDTTRMGVMGSTNSENMKTYLIRALLSVFESEKEDLTESSELRDFINKLMDS